MPLAASTYYLSTTGSDTNAGTSPAQAWRTLNRVSAAHLLPGDRVLLAGGQVFTGSLVLSAGSQGTPSQPLRFESYGAGRATIASDADCGFYAHNAAGIELRRLAFVGSGRLNNQTAGVVFYLDSTAAQLTHLRLDSLDVSGYREAGVSIGSWNGTSGYRDVRVTNCTLHANGTAGLSSYAFFPLPEQAHHDWYVGNCTAYDNAGRADLLHTNSGSGIVLSGIDGALVEKCVAYHNGWLNANPGGGPVGIWGWSCNNLTIQLCESHHNLSGTSKDGGGFDLDGGCTNSVLQYNYSHDNQGPGYLLAQFDDAPAMHDLAVRYNISENDARGYGQSALLLWSSGASGGIERASIYNNTVLLGPTADGSVPQAFSATSGGISQVALRNNLLQTSANLPVVKVAVASGLRLEGNCYWTPGAPLLLEWAGTSYASLADWRAATGQEMLAGPPGPRATGLAADPQLPAGTTASPASSGSRMALFNPGVGSALLGAGLSLAADFNLDPGPRDFFGNATPGLTAGNIGASEARPQVLASVAAPAAAPWCQVYPTVASSQVTVLVAGATAQPIELQLYDMLGRLRQHWSQPGRQLRAGGVVLPVQGLAPGRYVLRVQNAGRQYRQSLVVGAE